MANESLLELSNGRVSLEMRPEFGARVTKLTDLETGLQWLTEGECEGDPGNEAQFLGEQARGWDECFPTISSCDVDFWGNLRDHGLLWGRPWEAARTDRAIQARYVDERFIFHRSLSLDGRSVIAEYAVRNTGEKAFSYIWSQHCILEIQAGEVIQVPGKSLACRISQISRMGENIQSSGLNWPVHDSTGLDLSKALDKSERFHAKIHGIAEIEPGQGPAEIEASVIGRRGRIRFIWDREKAPGLGLWLNFGAWPSNAPGQQVAVEPTTSDTDCLEEAMKRQCARILKPDETHEWTVRIELMPS